MLANTRASTRTFLKSLPLTFSPCKNRPKSLIQLCNFTIILRYINVMGNTDNLQHIISWLTPLWSSLACLKLHQIKNFGNNELLQSMEGTYFNDRSSLFLVSQSCSMSWFHIKCPWNFVTFFQKIGFSKQKKVAWVPNWFIALSSLSWNI